MKITTPSPAWESSGEIEPDKKCVQSDFKAKQPGLGKRKKS